MKITITDYYEYQSGLENDGGHYIYYTTIERLNGKWYRNDFSSCDFEEKPEPWEIDGSEVKQLIESAKNDYNCKVKFSR